MDATDLDPDLVVTRDDEGRRYELHDGPELLSWASFSVADGVVTVPHVETRLQHRGNAYSSALMAGIVDDLRANASRIDPVCVVARRYVQALPDAAALMVR